MMAQAVASIHALSCSQRQVFLSSNDLFPIHPIDRGPAMDKALMRRDVALENRSLFLGNKNRLSLKMLSSIPAWSSINGVGVVESSTKGKYYTFEGNGRLFALRMAFPDVDFKLEVQLFEFEESDLVDVQRRYGSLSVG